MVDMCYDCVIAVLISWYFVIIVLLLCYHCEHVLCPCYGNVIIALLWYYGDIVVLLLL